MKVGLVLEGGAMRGLYTAGVIDTFLKEKIDVDTIIGVSAGAVFGMNYKSKQIGRVLRYNKAYVGNKDYMGVYSFLKTGNVMNEEFCFEKLIDDLDPIDYQSYQESPVDFYAVVTNLQTGKAEYKLLDTLDNYDQVEYLRASGSMPFVSHIIPGFKYSVSPTFQESTRPVLGLISIRILPLSKTKFSFLEIRSKVGRFSIASNQTSTRFIAHGFKVASTTTLLRQSMQK